jgi:hypothetical protein
MTRYAIRRIALFPAFKFGSSVGGVIMLLPGFLLGLLTRAVVGILRSWLEAWQALSVGPLEADPLNLLKLSDFLLKLQAWDDRGWLLILILTLATAAIGALLAGLLTLLGAVVYNFLATLTGGLAVEVQPVGGATGGRLPAEGRGAAPEQRGRGAEGRRSGGAGEQGRLLQRPSAQDGAWLTLSGNPQQRWPLKSGVTRLGSAPDNDVTLADLALRHAEIRFEGDRYILYDLSNGQTWVNDRHVAGRNLLKEGFKIRLGSHELIFHRQS